MSLSATAGFQPVVNMTQLSAVVLSRRLTPYNTMRYATLISRQRKLAK
jgi:hypothetical protein